jgi:hypothetical protein
MKFRALNIDYHAEASYRLWEQCEKEPRVIIRLLGPEEIALVSNKDGDKSIVSDAALNSLPDKNEEHSSVMDESSYNAPSMIEGPEIMIDTVGNQELHEVSRQ